MDIEWKFDDPENVAVYTTKGIMKGGKFISYVSHDDDDGAWQFHDDTPGSVPESEAMIVSLKRMVELDSTIAELADLPLGWHAWRVSINSAWSRAPIET